MSSSSPTICLSATVFRANLFVLIDWVEAERGRVIVLLDGQPVAVLEPEEELASSPRRIQLRRKIALLVGQTDLPQEAPMPRSGRGRPRNRA
jgi:PHD/YefM family antitoxin component YafN of YafNO toxin-antitoxin module